MACARVASNVSREWPYLLWPTYHVPTYHVPTYYCPTYHGPTYHGPTYRDPTYHGPTYRGLLTMTLLTMDLLIVALLTKWHLNSLEDVDPYGLLTEDLRDTEHTRRGGRTWGISRSADGCMGSVAARFECSSSGGLSRACPPRRTPEAQGGCQRCVMGGKGTRTGTAAASAL